jgi:hypothetical protein
MVELTRSLRWRVVVWSCVTVAVAALAALPLLESLAGESAVAGGLGRSNGLTVRQPGVTSVDAFRTFERSVDGRVNARLGSATAVRVTELGAAGPLTLTTVNGSSPPGGGARQLEATFVDHLAEHVRVAAGQLPPEGLGGNDPAVTMPQAAADQLGLHLSDRVCLAFVPKTGSPALCARIVGLWRPVNAGDPIWGGSPPGLQVMLTAYDFFRLAGGAQPRPPVAGVRYQLDPAALDRDRLGQVATGLQELRHDLAGSNLQLETSLDRSLAQLDERQRAAAALMHLLIATLVLLSLVLVAVVTRRFADLHLDELATLRQQGWGAGRVTRRILARFVAPVGLAVPSGLLLAVIGLAVLSALPFGVSPSWLRPADLVGEAVVLLGGLAAIGVLLWIAARSAAASDPSPATLTFTSGSAQPARGRRVGWAVVLVLAGLATLLAASRLGSGSGGPVAAALPALALALLGVAAVILLPLTASVPKRQQGELAGTLAGLQIERRRDQHGWAVLLVVVAIGAGGLAVRAALPLLLHPGEVGAALPARGFLAAALACLLFGLAISTAGYGLHFLGVARRRAWEYGSLFTRDPPKRTVGDSVGIEQAVVLKTGLMWGLLAGVVLALAAPFPTRAGPLDWLVSALAVAVVALLFLGGAVLVGRPARQRYEVLR